MVFTVPIDTVVNLYIYLKESANPMIERHLLFKICTSTPKSECLCKNHVYVTIRMSMYKPVRLRHNRNMYVSDKYDYWIVCTGQNVIGMCHCRHVLVKTITPSIKCHQQIYAPTSASVTLQQHYHKSHYIST